MIMFNLSAKIIFEAVMLEELQVALRTGFHEFPTVFCKDEQTQNIFWRTILLCA